MAYAVFNGRLQDLTVGRAHDLRTTYHLATLPRVMLEELKITPDMMLFKDGEHSRLHERMEEMPLLGELEGIVIGIGGGDPPNIPPEQVLPEWEDTAKRFFNPKKNPRTYFERMLLMKKFLKENVGNDFPVDLAKVDFVPKFPHHFYPSVVGEFEPPEDQFAFQYLGVDVDRHWQRIHTKGPDERNITCIYRDFRQYDQTERNVSLITPEALSDVQEREYDIWCDYFTPEDNVELPGKERIEKMLEDGERHGHDVVFGVKCDPRDSDKAAKDGLAPYEMMVRGTAFQRYQFLKSHLKHQGVNWKKVHITFAPPEDRIQSYLPIFNTGEASS